MKKIPHYLLILAIAVLMSANSYSQGGFSVHGGLAIPISDFADDDVYNEVGGGAALGFSLGAKYQYQLIEGGLGIYLSTNFNYNGLKKSLKDVIQEQYDNMAGTSVDINYTKYINIPVTAGLYYEYKANEAVSLFGELGLGVDFLKITDMKMEVNSGKFRITNKSKPQMAFEFGGGLILKDKYIFDLHYCGLGKHDMKTRIEYDGGNNEIGDSEIKVSLLTVSLGLRF
jgi:hypothetical protein